MKKLGIIFLFYYFQPLIVDASICWDLNKTSCSFSPSSILSGPLFQLGDFKHCLKDLREQYCLLEIRLSSGSKNSTFWSNIEYLTSQPTRFPRDVLTCGVCVPHDVSPDDILRGIRRDLAGAAEKLGVAASVSISPSDCWKSNSLRLWNTADYTVGGILLLLVGLTTIGTAIDFILHSETDAVSLKILLAFSIVSNYRSLVSESSSEVKFFNGLRVILACLVIFGHVMYMGIVGPLSNLDLVETCFSNILYTPLLGGHVVIAGFFVMSGFLLSFKLLQYFETNCNISIKFYLSVVIDRFIRLTPPLAVVVAVTATLQRHTGEGPMWSRLVEKEAKACSRDWWFILLYVNNLATTRVSECLIHVWYVCADNQLFILGCLLFIVALRWPHTAKPLLGSCVLLSLITPFMVTYALKLDPMILHLPKALRNPQDDPNIRFSYIPTYSNISPYLLGLMVGYYCYFWRINRKPQLPQKIVPLLWVLVFLAIFGTLFSSYPFYQPWYTNNALVAAAYSALYRTIFGAGFALMILLLSMGYGENLAHILSWNHFTPLSRLTYCMYLVHFSILEVKTGGANSTIYASHFDVLMEWFTTICQSVALALLLSIVVELPARNIMNLFKGQNSYLHKKTD